MNKKSFKVVNSKEDILLSLWGCSIMIFFGCYILKYADDRFMYMAGTGAILVGIGTLYTECIICLKVIDTTIKVRTYWGKKYTFTCSEIDKIYCSEIESPKRGIKQALTISAKGRKIRIWYEMDGIKELATYFLEQKKVNFIGKDVISQSTVRKLKQYIEWKTFEKERKEKKRNKRINEAINVLDNDTNIVTLMNYTQEGEVNSLFERIGGYGQT